MALSPICAPILIKWCSQRAKKRNRVRLVKLRKRLSLLSWGITLTERKMSWTWTILKAWWRTQFSQQPMPMTLSYKKDPQIVAHVRPKLASQSTSSLTKQEALICRTKASDLVYTTKTLVTILDHLWSWTKKIVVSLVLNRIKVAGLKMLRT